MPHRARAAEAVPDTLAVLAGPGERAGSPGFPVGYLGVTWAGGGVCGVRLRTAAGWSDWQSMPHGDAPEGERCLSLVPANGAQGFEVQAPADATDVRIVAINTTDGPRRRAAGAVSIGLAGADGELRGDFGFQSRAAWGADESMRFGPDGSEALPMEFFPVQALTVHHTVTPNNDPDPAATVRAMYHFHAVAQAWGDIGYHLLIDEAGTVYEGRWSGDDPVPVFGGSPQDKPQMSNGSHVGGFNAGNVGVALLGDLSAGGPTQAARDSLVEVLAALAAATGLDPLAEVDYLNPINGSTRRVPVISGHRDWAATACPGDSFHPTLPGVRSDVAARLAQRSSAP